MCAWKEIKQDMKTILITNYTFDKATKKVTFNDFTSIELNKILSIVDTTNGQSLYSYRLPGFGGTVLNNVLTLSFDTTSNQFANDDKLYIEMVADGLSTQIVESAARTSNYASGEINNYGFKGALLAVSTTAVAGTDTPTLVVTVEMKEPVSGTWVAIPNARTVNITTTGKTLLLVYPGITAETNSKTDYVLPRVYRIIGTITGTTPSFTFSISANYIE